MWIPITLLLLVGALSAYLNVQENTEDMRVLRHTIAVNLSILSAELDELVKIAANAETSQATAANLLLQDSTKIALLAENHLYSASRSELENLLGRVFDAMNLCSRARRILNACDDYSPFLG